MPAGVFNERLGSAIRRKISDRRSAVRAGLKKWNTSETRRLSARRWMRVRIFPLQREPRKSIVSCPRLLDAAAPHHSDARLTSPTDEFS